MDQMKLDLFSWDSKLFQIFILSKLIQQVSLSSNDAGGVII